MKTKHEQMEVFYGTMASELRDIKRLKISSSMFLRHALLT